MAFLRKKNKVYKWLYSYPVIILLLVLVILLIKPVWNVYLKYSEARENFEIMEEKKVDILERMERLEKNISRLDTDIGVEEELRIRHNMGREGERMVIIMENEGGLRSERIEEEKGWFGRSWDKLKGVFGGE